MAGDSSVDDVVYGYADKVRLVFLLSVTVHQLRDDLKDVFESKTWGELRQRLKARGRYQELLADSDDTEGDPDQSPYSVEHFPRTVGVDWPPIPEMLMLDWLPDDLAKRYGEAVTTTLSGDYLSLDEACIDALATELTRRGYRCERDDAMLASLLV